MEARLWLGCRLWRHPSVRGFILGSSLQTLHNEPGEAQSPAGSQSLGELLLGQFHGCFAGLIVAGTQPAGGAGFMHRFENLPDEQGFELFGGVLDLVRTRFRWRGECT